MSHFINRKRSRTVFEQDSTEPAFGCCAIDYYVKPPTNKKRKIAYTRYSNDVQRLRKLLKQRSEPKPKCEFKRIIKELNVPKDILNLTKSMVESIWRGEHATKMKPTFDLIKRMVTYDYPHQNMLSYDIYTTKPNTNVQELSIDIHICDECNNGLLHTRYIASRKITHCTNSKCFVHTID